METLSQDKASAILTAPPTGPNTPISELLKDSNLKKSREFTTQVRVIYADTDKMGVVLPFKVFTLF